MNSFKLAFVLAFMSRCACPALAEDAKPADEAFIQRLYARAPDKNHRTTPAFVRNLRCRASRGPSEAEGERDEAARHRGKNPGGRQAQSLRSISAIKYRTRKGDYDSSGECGHVKVGEDRGQQRNPRLGCSCRLRWRRLPVSSFRRDNKSVLLRVERVRIWRDDKPDEDASYDLEGGADDRVFRLDRADLSQCRALIRDRKELVSLRSK